jgi:hypothetical protein
VSLSELTRGECGLIAAGILLTAAMLAQTPPQPVQPETVQQKREQLAADSARLLKLATELKADVDKTTKDQLSITVVKKADEVEKLARKVRDEMKLIPAS